MKRGRLALAAVVLALCAGTAACVLPPDTQTILASAGGTGPADAYRVASWAQQRDVLAVLGLGPRSQSVRVINGQPYSVVVAADGVTGETRDVWFDIARFYGRE